MHNADESGIFFIEADQYFHFRCDPEVSCFNACCRDLNQYLSPYDVLRLKSNLGVSSSVFLETYTVRHDGPESGLPVVTLKPGNTGELTCPFVTRKGCMVYPDRPASCRMYPVMRIAKRDRADGRIREQYMLICEPHCFGFEMSRKITVNQWIKEQGLPPYNAANDLFIEVLSAKRQNFPGMLPEKISDTIYTALYDSDRFIEMTNDKTNGCLPERIDPLSFDEDSNAYLQYAYNYVIALFKRS